MKKTRDYAKVIRWMTSGLLLAIVFVTILQVIFRFVFNSPFTWTDEIGRFFLIWTVFLGVGAVSFDDKHLAVNMLQENMSPMMHFITNQIMRLIIIIFLAIVIYTSIEVVKVANLSKTGALEIPYSYWRVAAPFGAALMIIFTVLRSIIEFKALREGTYKNTSKIEEEVDG